MFVCIVKYCNIFFFFWGGTWIQVNCSDCDDDLSGFSVLRDGGVVNVLLEHWRIVINIHNLHREERGDAAVSGLDSEDVDMLVFSILWYICFLDITDFFASQISYIKLRRYCMCAMAVVVEINVFASC